MTFNVQRLVLASTGANAGMQTTTDTAGDSLIINGPQLWTYESETDTLATIAAANYFANKAFAMSVGDFIMATGTDASNMYIVTAVNSLAGTITVDSFSASGVVATANIQDGAVTTAKIADGAVTAAKIGDLEITNSDVSASAAIAFSKLATLASGNVLVGSGGGVATSVAVTGDVTISNAGVTAIASDVIVNADVKSDAAIALSKLAALTSGQIIVGSAGNVPTAVAMSGDVAIVASGATTIQAGAVDKAMLAATVRPSHMIVFAGQETTVGGAAAEAFTVAGALAATDTAFVQVVNDGTANVTVLQAVVTNDTLTVTFSANPGNDAVFNYQIIRATS